MNKPIIEIKNISKKYNITHQRGGYIALRDVLTNIAKSPFKFFKHKAKVAIGKASKEEFWALKNINFEIEKGDTIGIIGHNGAGKSTLLKILTSITPPTTGEIKMRGRVASLLEVGTGFHPELTGRENIFLNGAILGMTKKEIVNKFDEIVKFSGVEKFLDTPVKRYSSGMHVRLAFSVAAHMDPDILLVDEVLAVGDADFQKKCLGKMDEVTNESGRTILFVSHNMEAIKRLCNKCVLLKNGEIKMIGETKKVIDEYTQKRSLEIGQKQDLSSARRTGNQDIKFTNIELKNIDGSEIIKSDEGIKVIASYKKRNKETLENPNVVISIFSEQFNEVSIRLDSDLTKNSINEINKNQGEIICETDQLNLKAGIYYIALDFSNNGQSCDHIDYAYEFEVITDIEKYDYKLTPNKNIPSHIIKYNFKD